MIQITLPDGSQRSYDQAVVTPMQVAPCWMRIGRPYHS